VPGELPLGSETIMAQLFEDEKKYPDNRTRDNFVFLGYPYEPALPRDDYQRVIRDLQGEVPVRLWYFLDEITTTEMTAGFFS